MARLTYEQVAALVLARRFALPATAVAVVFAESGGLTDARNLVNNPTSPAHGSWDRGLWQINSYWHSRLTDRQADNVIQATDYAYRISAGGSDFSPWNVHDSGAYVRHLGPALLAVEALLSDFQARIDEEYIAGQAAYVELRAQGLEQKDITALWCAFNGVDPADLPKHEQ